MKYSVWLGFLYLLLVACGRSEHAPAVREEPVVNVPNWFDYINPEVVREFQ
jgi:spermidine/putrescine-binding protein